jgi:hypothetical protein
MKLTISDRQHCIVIYPWFFKSINLCEALMASMAVHSDAHTLEPIGKLGLFFIFLHESYYM